MLHRKIKLVLTKFVMFTILLIAIGCSEDSNPSGPEDNTSENPSKIEGRVAGGNGHSGASKINKTNGVEGATVTVVRVQADGTFETVSNESVTTNANGEFNIETNVDSESNLIVVAEKGNQTWKAVVSGKVENGSTVYCPPMSNETTVEAELYSQIVAEAKTSLVQMAQIGFYVNANLAAAVKGNTSLMSNVLAAIEAEAKAEAEAVSESYFDMSSAEYEAAKEARAEAHAKLDADLHAAAESNAQYRTAIEAYQEAEVKAFTDQSMNSTQSAKLFSLSTEALANASAEFSSNIELELRRQSAKKKQKSDEDAVVNEYDQCGASEDEKNTVLAANASLKALIDAATAINEIDAAFEAYQVALIELIKVTLSTNSSVIAAIETEINGSAGVKANLESTVSATVSTSVLVEAYLAFYNSIKSIVEAQLTDASSAEIDAVIDIMILANTSS